jgi:hypothetical protein
VTTKLGLSRAQLFQRGAAVVRNAIMRPSPSFLSIAKGAPFRTDAITLVAEPSAGFQAFFTAKYCSMFTILMNGLFSPAKMRKIG